MTRFLLLSAAFLTLGACAQINQNASQGASSSSASSAPDYSSVPAPALTQTYVDKKAGYSIQYPDGFKVERNKQLIANEYEVTGTAFMFPASYAADTTLLEAEIHVGTTVTCPSLDSPSQQIIDGFPFDQSTWMGVAAGNLYEGTVYTSYKDGKCYVATLYIHSCNLGPDCTPGHTKTFPRIPMKALFAKMMQTFRFQ